MQLLRINRAAASAPGPEWRFSTFSCFGTFHILPWQLTAKNVSVHTFMVQMQQSLIPSIICLTRCTDKDNIVY